MAVRQHAEQAAEVVAVRVRVDQPGHRAVTAVFAVQRERRRRGLGGDQGVDDDDTCVALDQCQVRQVQVPDLVETW